MLKINSTETSEVLKLQNGFDIRAKLFNSTETSEVLKLTRALSKIVDFSKFNRNI